MGHLHAFVTTPFDPGVFHEVHAQRTRRTVAYLFLLVLLSTATVTTLVAAAVHRTVDKLLPEIDKIPTITIRNGEASADVEQPWVKKLGEQDGKQVVLIIDTTGVQERFGEQQCGLFLKKRELAVRDCDGEERAFSLARVPDVTVGPEVARTWVSRARWVLPLGFAVIAFLWFTFAKLLQALLLVLVALIASTGRKRPLGFGELFTVGTYALGPAVLADCVTWLLPFRLPFFIAIYAATAIVYAIVGARRVPDDPQLTLV
jgi:hypothetical protein